MRLCVIYLHTLVFKFLNSGGSLELCTSLSLFCRSSWAALWTSRPFLRFPGLKPPLPKFLQRKVNNGKETAATSDDNKGHIQDVHSKVAEGKEIQKWKAAAKEVADASAGSSDRRLERRARVVKTPTEDSPQKEKIVVQKQLRNSKNDKGRVDDRYPKRSVSKKHYEEEDLLSDDEFLYCEDCGREYEGPCPEHGPMTLISDSKVPKDGSVPQRALKTLPSFLSVGPSGIRKAGLGVWTETALPPRLVFGPYEGRIVRDRKEAFKSGYSWQVEKGGRAHHWVEAAEDGASNWLRYVNCAPSEERQNLVAFQHRRRIYYRTRRTVPPHTELLVWYGPGYARKLGIDLKHPGPAQLQFPSDAEYHKCDRCGQLFTDADTLRRHEKRHSRPDRRHRCPYSSDRACDLRRHLLTHTGERPHPCSLCPKAFTEKSALQRHLLVHSGEKLHACPVCRRTFSRLVYLRRHQRALHSDARPYACSVCGKAYSDDSNRQRHQRGHGGQRPHRCPHCDRRFARSQHLKGHVARLHTRVFPHSCRFCEKGFWAPGEMKAHVQKKHAEG